MSSRIDRGSETGRTHRQPYRLVQIGILAGLIVSISPSAGGLELLAQDPVQVTPDAVSYTHLTLPTSDLV